MNDRDFLESLREPISQIDTGCSFCVQAFIVSINDLLAKTDRPWRYVFEDDGYRSQVSLVDVVGEDNV